VRAIDALTADQIERIYELTARAAQHLAEWNVADATAAARITTMRREWPEVASMLTPDALLAVKPLDRLVKLCGQYSIDTQELFLAMILEPFGELIDSLTSCMATPFAPRIDPQMTCNDLSRHIADDWAWACEIDFAAKQNCAQFWYVSEEKQEPRLGNRHEEDGADLESPLDVARQVKALSAELDGAKGNVAQFLASHPHHRSAVRPKSDRWTRITLAQGAPLFDELDNADNWWLPTFAA